MAKTFEMARLTRSAGFSKFSRVIPISADWNLGTRGWVALQLSQGIAYALGSKANKDLPIGGILVCPPHSKITLTASVLECAVFQGIVLRLESLAAFLTPLERRCLETTVAEQLAPFVALPPEHAMARQLKPILDNDQAPNLASRLALAQLFAEFVDPELRRAVNEGFVGGNYSQEAKGRLHGLMTQWPESELAGLSLSDVAGHLHCCERHASRLFREEWGCSFPSYVSELRLKLACQLLAQEALKINDVALDSGHGSLAHFNYVFKKQFRMTPTQWRERNL